jgi:signal peptidase I
MSIQPPETEESNGTHADASLRMTMRPPATTHEPFLSNEQHADVAVVDADVVVAVPEITVPQRTAARTSAPRRSTDYRLRGLDLDAQGLAETRAKPARKRHPSIRRRRRRLLIQVFVVLTVLALAAVVLRATVIQPFSVTSTSMVPTLQPGTDVLVVKARFLIGGIDAGDIVVIEHPEGSDCSIASDARHLVSRVIGLPGQTIWSDNESIYIDGERLDQPGWRNPPFGEVGTTEIARTEIPSGSYFVLGDNRTDTCDSRAFGPVPGSLVVGEVVATTARNGHPSVHFI